MKMYQVTDKEFKAYGKVLGGDDTRELMNAMKEIKLPDSGTAYEASIESLEKCAIGDQFRTNAYGGMAVQIGMCWGHNRKLNCLEYHRDSELNIGAEDYILLLAKESEIENGMLDTEKVNAFCVPAGLVVEVYATTLHYAPCETDDNGFRVAIVLPRGTNGDVPKIDAVNIEDQMLWARNKWLLAHPDTSEAKEGAYIGLKGNNIEL